MSRIESQEKNGPARWGFIGAGQMATALARGMLSAGVVEPTHIRASDPSEAARQAFTAATGIPTENASASLARDCTILLLAVKPQAMPAVLAELRPEVGPHHLVISIAAGVTMASLRAGLGDSCRLARVMPNTPALVGAGAAAYCLDDPEAAEDERLVRLCLGSVGLAVRVPEGSLDAVTGLSGSGPAYVYVLIEALADGGVRMGLPRATAQALAAQTVLGAARMVLETGIHPGQLKDNVTSPGGTTISGLHALERAGFRAAAIDAVEAATLRSQELGRPGA